MNKKENCQNSSEREQHIEVKRTVNQKSTSQKKVNQKSMSQEKANQQQSLKYISFFHTLEYFSVKRVSWSGVFFGVDA